MSEVTNYITFGGGGGGNSGISVFSDYLDMYKGIFNGGGGESERNGKTDNNTYREI